MTNVTLEPDKKPWENFELVPLPELKTDFSFFNFQAYAIYQSLLQDRYFLSLPTGTGKTICSIASFLYYKTVYPNSQLLVVTTNSALFQFAGEFDKFFQHDLNVKILHESAMPVSYKNYKKKRQELIQAWGKQEVDVLIMNYPMFRIEREVIKKATLALKKAEVKTFFVLDESTAFKALNTQTSKTVAAITPHVDKVLGLTATLIKGKLEEIYGIFKNVGISLCSSKKIFEELYCIMFQHPTIWYLKRIRGYRNVALFKEKIEPYSLILRKSELSADLPPFQIQKRFLGISAEQNMLLKEIYTGVLSLTDEGFDFTNPENTDKQKLLEALTEVGYIKRALASPEIVAPERFIEDSPKTSEILRMLNDEFTDEKIVIYSPSKRYLKVLEKAITSKKNNVESFYNKPLEISGDIPVNVRQENMNAFTNTNIHNVMLLTDAGSEAINLQAAQVMIIVSLPDSWGKLIQLVGRISRIGSKHKNLLLIYLLHEDSQDFDEYCILQRQGMLFQAIQGEVEKGILDTSVLRGVLDTGIPDEEFVNKSVSHLLIGTRKRRAEKYI